jgi:DNA-binding SARP family transcriptional activator
VALPSGRQRSLLALLLYSGGVPLSRDRLIDELWGERPPSSAVSALHVHLSKLRGLLDGLLVLEAAGYALQPDGLELDVWRFDRLVERARSEPAQAGALLAEALALFRGEPLCDVASEGTVAPWRRALEEKRSQATLSRLDAELACGAAGTLIAELEGLAGEHPFEERVWGQLMLALYRAGRHADALEAYQRAPRRASRDFASGLTNGK